MKYQLLYIFLFLIGCQSKEAKPELDYVNIEIFPALAYPPAYLGIDLINKTMVFSGLQDIRDSDSNCSDYYEKAHVPIAFVYIDLTQEEFFEIKNILNNDFLEAIQQTNKAVSNDKTVDPFDGVYFEFDILCNKQMYATDDLLILNKIEKNKMFKLFKLLEKHLKNEANKRYIEQLSFHLE